MTDIAPTLYISLYSQILAFGWALQQVQLDGKTPHLDESLSSCSACLVRHPAYQANALNNTGGTESPRMKNLVFGCSTPLRTAGAPIITYESLGVINYQSQGKGPQKAIYNMETKVPKASMERPQR